MKKFKINTIITIIVYTIITFGFSSCKEKTFNDTDQNKFVVKKVLNRNGMSKMTTYKVLMLDASGPGEVNFWITDTIGKYKVGDKLCLQFCR